VQDPVMSRAFYCTKTNILYFHCYFSHDLFYTKSTKKIIAIPSINFILISFSASWIQDIATTVFTPLELGTVGLTEEEAVQMYGEEAVDSYAAEFEPLEWNLLHRHADAGVLCYIKVITNRLDGDRVIGMHIAAPNAGEIIQGFSLAFRKGITHKVYLFPTSDFSCSLDCSFFSPLLSDVLLTPCIIFVARTCLTLSESTRQ
jgi:hypothetical protein